MLGVEMKGTRAVIDLRERILAGEHPREEVFEYVKKSDGGITFEIHTPRVPGPLIKGLEDMGLDVDVEEVASDHVIVTTIKTEEM